MEVLFKVSESDESRALVAYEKWRDTALLEKPPAAQLERRSTVIVTWLESPGGGRLVPGIYVQGPESPKSVSYPEPIPESLVRTALLVGLMAGVCLLVVLVVQAGASDVLAAIAAAGWGVVLVVIAHGPGIVVRGLSLGVLVVGRQRPSVAALSAIWWIGESVNNLLPVAQIGGELVRARLFVRAGLPPAEAGAIVLVGLTAGVLMLAVFVGLGATMLGSTGLAGADALALQVAVGSVAFAAAVLGFYCVQRRGLFSILTRVSERLAGGRSWAALAGSAAEIDRAVAALYRRPGRLVAACGLRLAAYVAGVGELWLTFAVLGHPITLTEALMLESLVVAVRNIGFVVPAALGLQEGSYVVLGALIGVPAPVALAASLVKRVRELALGVPGVLVWQFGESHGLLHRVRR